MKIRFLARALQQTDQALAYIHRRAPRGAAKVEARLSAMLELLKLQPYAGARTGFRTVRRFHLTPYPYFIDYEVRGDEIVVQRFRHSARRPMGDPRAS